MGYRMDLRSYKFTIPYENMDSVVRAIQELDDGTKYSWVQSGFSEFDDIDALFEEWNFEITHSIDGTILLDYTSEKRGSEKILFQAIAPFVVAGSFLEWHGEDGEMWRWIFDGKTMKEIKPKITWSEEEQS